MAAHACLKNEFTEDEKYRNLMRWLKYLHSEQVVCQGLQQCTRTETCKYYEVDDWFKRWAQQMQKIIINIIHSVDYY